MTDSLASGRWQSAKAIRRDLIRPHAARLSLAFFLLFASVLVQLCYPKAIAFFFDHAVSLGAEGWQASTMALMIAVLLGQAVVSGAQSYLFSSTGSMIVARLRKALFQVFLNQEMAFFDHQKVGELMSLLSSDVEQLQDSLTMSLGVTVQAAVMCLGSSVMLIMLSPGLSLLMALVIPPIVVCSRWVSRRVRETARARQQELAHCGHIAQDVLSNVRLVHAFGGKAAEGSRYAKAADITLKLSLVCNRYISGFNAFGALLQSLALLAAIWIGGKLIGDRSMTVGSLTSFVLYAGLAITSATTVSSMWAHLMRSAGASDRVFEILCRVPPPAEGEKVGILRGDVRFDAVHFAYPARGEKTVLEGFSLHVRAGERVALVGPSGAGKSTVVNLLLGFYRPSRGALYFDGRDAADLDPLQLRSNIAVVEQEPALFSGSILENILYAASDGAATRDNAIDAAIAANLHDFVIGLPQGYDTPVGARGLQLSGGQKQRVAIARAVLRDPAILILDEATSALDSENEEKIRIALDRLMEKRTSIIIAHRLSTIANADRIVVLEDGRIEQLGDHRGLLADAEGTYARLIKAQADLLLRAQ